MCQKLGCPRAPRPTHPKPNFLRDLLCRPEPVGLTFFFCDDVSLIGGDGIPILTNLVEVGHYPYDHTPE